MFGIGFGQEADAVVLEDMEVDGDEEESVVEAEGGGLVGRRLRLFDDDDPPATSGDGSREESERSREGGLRERERPVMVCWMLAIG